MLTTQRFASSLFRLLVLSAASGVFLVACGQDATAPASAPAAPVAEVPAAAPVPQLPAGSIEAVALEIGATLDADGRVSASMERFRRNDIVHASLVTVGEAPAAMLQVQWRDANGTEVAVDERAIQTTGPAVHTFSRGVEGGWLPGRYEVEVLLNGESAGVRPFEVR